MLTQILSGFSQLGPVVLSGLPPVLTFAGGFARKLTAFRAVGGTLSFAGGIAKKISKAFAGVLSFIGSVANVFQPGGAPLTFDNGPWLMYTRDTTANIWFQLSGVGTLTVRINGTTFNKAVTVTPFTGFIAVTGLTANTEYTYTLDIAGVAVAGMPVAIAPKGIETALLEYHHVGPNGRPSPVRDFYGYDALTYERGATPRESRQDGRNVVTDLQLLVDLEIESGGTVELVLKAYKDTFRFLVPAEGSGRNVRILHNGVSIAEGPADMVPAGEKVCLEVANVDHKLILKVDGRRVIDLNRDGKFDEADDPTYEPLEPPGNWTEPEERITAVRMGVQGAAATVHRLRLSRDVYYTKPPNPNSVGLKRPRHGWASKNNPYTLREDEFFVLGDNSPKSADSRLWDGSPVVLRKNLIGKAFFVYWPAAGERYWVPVRVVPDATKFRFIR